MRRCFQEAIVILALFGQHVVAKSDCPSSSVPPKTVNCEKVGGFRTLNGSCNSKNSPTWGIAGQVFNRYFASGNSIDRDTLRKSVTGKDLPNPRVVSTTVHTDQNFTSNLINIFFAFFGLFVAHDMEKTAVPSSSGCCNQKSQKPCLPIPIPANDSFYEEFGVKCLEFARSCKKEGKLGVGGKRPIDGRFQFNDNTVFLDLSQIYGSDESTARKLRTFSIGTLKTSVASDGQSLLPTVEQAGMSGSVKGTFAAGDSRVNMFPQLTAIYTIFVLAHNRLAMELKATFAKPDEWLFQQARRILIGIYQNIIYTEYLPYLVGEEVMRNFALPIKVDTMTDYEDTLYPNIANENVVAGNLHMFSTIRETMEYGTQKVPLRQTFFNASYLQAPSGLLRVIQGMSAPAQDFDRFVTAELTNHFLQQNQQYGQDIVAITLQRGRDHTSTTYVEAVKLCPQWGIIEFSDLVKFGFMDRSNVDLLKQVYADVRDIDLFTGGLSEKRIPRAVLGQTLACLQGVQFNHLKWGDRLFFSHRQSLFTQEEYAQISRFTLTTLVCRLVKGYPEDSLEMLLLLPNSRNKPVVCKNLSKLNLR